MYLLELLSCCDSLFSLFLGAAVFDFFLGEGGKSEETVLEALLYTADLRPVTAQVAYRHPLTWTGAATHNWESQAAVMNINYPSSALSQTFWCFSSANSCAIHCSLRLTSLGDIHMMILTSATDDIRRRWNEDHGNLIKMTLETMLERQRLSGYTGK